MLWKAFGVLFISLVCGSAHALLINLGDTTLDTRSRLEWLDVTLTQGLSDESVIAGAGGHLGSGYRYATRSELRDLFSFYTNVEYAPGELLFPYQPVGLLDLLRSLGVVSLLGATLSNNMA